MRLCVILIAALFIGASPALAANVTINGHSYSVSDTEAASIALEAAKIEAAKTDKPAVTVDTVSKYAELGKTIGASLASTAKEMGVAVNEFAATPMGMLATWLIVYKLIGSDIIHLLVGLLWFAVALPTWFYMYRRAAVIKSIDYLPTEKGAMRKQVTFYTDRDNIGGTQFGFLLVGALVTAIGMLITFL